MIDELKRDGHMPGDAQLVRLLVLGAVNWTGRWYRDGGRLSLDEIAEGAARLFLRKSEWWVDSRKARRNRKHRSPMRLNSSARPAKRGPSLGKH